METVKGQVVSVTRAVAGSTLIVDAVATDTVLFLDDASAFDETGGSVSIEGADPVTYDSADVDASTITLSAGLAGGLTAYETFVAVSPEAPSQTAQVLLQDDSGVTVPAVVPQAMWALLSEGIREPEQREPVTLLLVGDDWTVYDVEFRPSLHDASTTPIVVSNVAGESATVDADGFTTFTNDPVPIRTIAGDFSTMAASGGYVYGGTASQIRKFDETTGEEVSGGGWPIAISATTSIAADGGYVYRLNSGVNIRKFDASNGVEVVAGGWPLAIGSAGTMHADGGFIYVSNGTTLSKYAATNGVEDTTADWPISGDLRRPAISGGYVYAADISSGAIRKFDDATGTEDTSGPFPLAGSYGNIAADDTYLYAMVPDNLADDLIDKIEIATGAVADSSGFPISLLAITVVAVDGNYLFANSSPPRAIRQFNRVEGYQSTNRNSSDGSDRVHSITVSDLTATGDVAFKGPTIADYLAVTWTKARKIAAQTTGTGTAETLGQSGELYGAFDGSGTNGDTAFWTESNGVFTILVDGVYDLSCWVEWASNATGYRLIGIALNGSTTLVGDTRNAVTGQVTRQSISPAGGVALSAGDTVELLVLQNSGGNLNVNSGSWFTISRRGALAA